MAISKKGKRRLSYNGKQYLWWVFEEYDQTEFDGIQIKIIDEDQTVILQYGIEQPEGERYLKVALAKDIGAVHLRCPKFEDENGAISPSGIHKMFEWVQEQGLQSILERVVYAWRSTEQVSDPVEVEKLFKKIKQLL